MKLLILILGSRHEVSKNLINNGILKTYGSLNFPNIEILTYYGSSEKRELINKDRGMGISKVLMDHLESMAQINGAKKIRLTVYKENKPAIYLYNKWRYIFSDKNEKELIGIKNL